MGEDQIGPQGFRSMRLEDEDVEGHSHRMPKATEDEDVEGHFSSLKSPSSRGE